MIDEDRTMQLFRYTSGEWSEQSHKPVVSVCEECGHYRITQKRHSHHLCKSCMLIGKNNPMFGKKHDAEAVRKMSLTHIGHRQSEETKQKIAIASTGRLHTEETKRKLSEAKIGEKNYNWKGGITLWRRRIWFSTSYKNWRSEIFKRDDYTCQMCWSRGGKLEAHHIHPVKDNRNTLLIFDIDNGITLCKKCHDKTKRKEYRYIKIFEDIIHNTQADDPIRPKDVTYARRIDVLFDRFVDGYVTPDNNLYKG